MLYNIGRKNKIPRWRQASLQHRGYHEVALMTYSLYALEARHKTALKKIFESLLTPQQYLALYPGTTYREIAEICDCSESLVKKWFSSGACHRKPHRNHLLALTLAHSAIQRIEHQRKA